MGCLNSNQNFDHWFGNIHLSGPCNRSCYFCIGQWMPGQDMNNNLGTEQLTGYDKFVTECKDKGITEVNITGTNTDPLMMQNLPNILKTLRNDFSNIGIRTNAVLTKRLIEILPLIDKFSVSVTSFNENLYAVTMGSGRPPELKTIVDEAAKHNVAVKLNRVMCPETMDDLFPYIVHAIEHGIKKINVREPYGQEHIGNPFDRVIAKAAEKFVFGNPTYVYKIDDNRTEVTYWDVHYTEVESVNLYADGHVSVDYPVSLGHSTKLGEVHDQTFFDQGRQASQWRGTKSET